MSYTGARTGRPQDFDRSKLPKWRLIEKLENDNAYYLAKLNEGPEDSDTFADAYSDGRRPLGAGTVIEFQLGDRKTVRVRTACEGVTGLPYLSINGGDYLEIRPQAANSFEVRPVRR